MARDGTCAFVAARRSGHDTANPQHTALCEALQVLLSASGLYRDRKLNFDSSVDIDIGPRRLDRHDQGVSGGSVEALQVWFFLPPSADRKHADGVSFRKISGRPTPHIGVDRAPVTESAEKPIVGALGRD